MTDLITDEIVEAAARAMHEWSTGSQPRSLAFNPAWDDATHDSKRYWLDVARTTLEAAAPLVAARALDQAREQVGAWPDDASVPVGVVRALLAERATDLRGGK